MQISRLELVPLEAIQAFSPVGVIQATSLGMKAEDPMPFPEHLEAAKPSLEWAVEWIYKERTAFSGWAQKAGLEVVEGDSLFESQARAQSARFMELC